VRERFSPDVIREGLAQVIASIEKHSQARAAG
jgi:hypothetical protein